MLVATATGRDTTSGELWVNGSWVIRFRGTIHVEVFVWFSSAAFELECIGGDRITLRTKMQF